MSLGNNSESFAQALLNLEDRRLPRFLELLEDYARSDIYIPKENIEPIITALMDIGDWLPEGDLISSSTYAKLQRLFDKLIHRFESYDERFSIFKGAIEKSTKSLYTIVYEITQLELQFAQYGSQETSAFVEMLTVTSGQLEELKKLAYNKVQNWAKDSRLAKHKQLRNILLVLKEWREKSEVDKLVNDMIKNDEGLVDFITSFLRESTVNDGAEKIHWRIDESIKNFVDLKDIEPRIRKILTSPGFAQLEEQKKLAIKTFLNSIDGKIKDSF